MKDVPAWLNIFMYLHGISIGALVMWARMNRKIRDKYILRSIYDQLEIDAQSLATTGKLIAEQCIAYQQYVRQLLKSFNQPEPMSSTPPPDYKN